MCVSREITLRYLKNTQREAGNQITSDVVLLVLRYPQEEWEEGQYIPTHTRTSAAG